ncbi:MAG TPA: ClpX C4-type zinc finger protein [Actinomycetota bacterium]|nr:ClpX C4-type zinc finger protein [Actinomycetota bacterium]
MRCSFCRRPSGSSRRMVGGPGEGLNQVFICDECVAMCAEILAETD